jgi:opacity protein-like surface antigen
VIFSGNVVVPIAISSALDWSPYGVVGLGGIHAWIHDAGDFDTQQTNLAFNFGAGLTYWLLDWLALRADFRLLHAFVDEEEREGGYHRDYDFVRVSLGVSFAPFRSSG